MRLRPGRRRSPAEQFEAVLTAFALIQHEHHDTELPVSLLHRGEHVARARQQLQDLVADLLATGAQAGEIRTGIAPRELASYCLHALTAAGSLPSETGRPPAPRIITVAAGPISATLLAAFTRTGASDPARSA